MTSVTEQQQAVATLLIVHFGETAERAELMAELIVKQLNSDQHIFEERTHSIPGAPEGVAHTSLYVKIPRRNAR